MVDRILIILNHFAKPQEDTSVHLPTSPSITPTTSLTPMKVHLLSQIVFATFMLSLAPALNAQNLSASSAAPETSINTSTDPSEENPDNIPGNEEHNNSQGSRHSRHHHTAGLSPCVTKSLNDADFTKLCNHIRAKSTDDHRKHAIEHAVKPYMLKAGQALQLTKLCESEKNRLDVAEYLFSYTCDRANYLILKEAFTSDAYAVEFSNYIAEKSLHEYDATQENEKHHGHGEKTVHHAERYADAPPPGTCYCVNNGFGDEEFNRLKAGIAAQTFTDTRKAVTRQGITERCITTDQAIELLSFYVFESDRLEMAKTLFDYVGDKEHYYKINEVFSFQSSVNELNRYISHKHQ